ncbi:MAG: hypothetical protein AB1711_02040 [Thermodesulfobacteriota bacterium]
MNEKAVHSLAVIIVLCLVVVVSSGLFWHLWHAWGSLIVGEIVMISIMGFLVRKVIRFG